MFGLIALQREKEEESLDFAILIVTHVVACINYLMVQTNSEFMKI